MNVDLPGTIRLLHRVLGFLTALSADELKDVAAGRRSLLLGGPEAAPGTTAHVVPGPRAETAGPRAETAGQNARPARGTKTTPPAKPVVPDPTDADYAEIAEKLRGFETVNDGAAYLSTLRLRNKKRRKSDLVRIGARMGLTLAESMRDADLESRLVNHAIGARRKYAGLNSW